MSGLPSPHLRAALSAARSVIVADSEVTVEVLLPGVLGLLAGKLTGALQREARLLLERK